MRNPVRVFKRKHDGTIKREFTGDLVEVTRDGWLAVYHDASRHESYKDGRPVTLDTAVERQRGTWTAPHIFYLLSTEQPIAVAFAFDALGTLAAMHADAALPATVEGRELTLVDLDLDLVVERDLSYNSRDFDTFEEHSRTMEYPEEVKAAAHEGLALAERLVRERAFPFDGSIERLLGRVMASEGPL